MLRFKNLSVKTWPVRINVRHRSANSKPLQSSEEDLDMPVEMEDPFKPYPKRCTLCGIPVDYKNVQLLSQFVSGYTGKILPQRNTGLCDKKYKDIVNNISHSRKVGLMPYMYKDTIFLSEPNLGNIKDQYHDPALEYGSENNMYHKFVNLKTKTKENVNLDDFLSANAAEDVGSNDDKI